MNSSVRRRKKYKFKKPSISKRIIIILSLLIAAVIGISIRLFYLQVLAKNDKYADLYDQLVSEAEITAERGNIYDRNMNILVQDSSAKSINVIPYSVKDPETLSKQLAEELNIKYDDVYKIVTKLEDDKVQVSDNLFKINTETLLASLNNPEAYYVEDTGFYVIPDKVTDAEDDARTIAATFNMDYDTALNYLTYKENTTQLIQSKVDNAKADELLHKVSEIDEEGEIVSTNGVELLEDKKRYYTNGNFASYIIGFTGNDHHGLYGVERTFDEVLSGTNGIVYYQKDATGNIITSQTKVIQQSERGSDLVLSIDSNIQSAAEKALENTVEEWDAKGGTAIVLNSKTGEVIAMASKPDYDLNDPYEVTDEYQSHQDEDFEFLSDSDQLEDMWKNPAVSFIYEPGSTFKPITVATALEEGNITPDSEFTCTGAIPIGNVVIHCTGIHGTQKIAETLENSCNPGLVQIITGVEAQDFYKYVYNFGFGETTGIELTGEESGIVNRVFQEDGSINTVDYSTFSFGQGLATTPIQIITALNSLINNGYYVKPTIIKSNNTTTSKQIVSQSTSETLREDMQGVIASKPGLQNILDGYTMGGKTGTAEKFVNGEYSSTKYVTSFFCFSPVDDPEYCAMVILDEPRTGADGASSAAPTAINILKQTLIYTGANPQEDTNVAVTVPDCVGSDLETVEKILEERGIEYSVKEVSEGTTILAQSIPSQSEYVSGNTLILTVGSKDEITDMIIPDFTGMTVQSVNEKTKELKIHLKIQGSGFAVEQSIPPGTAVEEGETITVKFEE